MRVLLIAEQANPEWTSVPLEGWSLCRALMAKVEAHVVTHVRNRDAFLRAGMTESCFTAIDSEMVAAPLYRLASLLRGGAGRGWTIVTACDAVAYYYFEHLLWRAFGHRIRAGEYSIVHRITPLSPTAPSLIAAKCARAGVPFVVGPLNGGVPWPPGFGKARRREWEWLSYVRGAHKLMPGYTSTRRNAAAVIVGSRDTLAQFDQKYRSKCVYVPENAVDPGRFPRSERKTLVARPLRVVFVGRLVPYKGADMLIEAAAPLIRAGVLDLEIIGDGPEMLRLRSQIDTADLTGRIRLVGWVDHRELHARLAAADVFAFPSIREFGGGVVVEAMAAGLVPVVVAYGGPAEIVTRETGYLVPIGSRAEIVSSFRRILGELSAHPEQISAIQQRAQQRALSLFTWEAKAKQILEVYKWVTGERTTKPDYGMPLRTDAPGDEPTGAGLVSSPGLTQGPRCP